MEQVPLQNPLQAEKTGWKIYSLLPELLKHSDFEPIRIYLNEDDRGIRRWQLA